VNGSLSGLAAVAAGGALGATGRYLLTLFAKSSLGDGFPYGTLSVNLIGCLLIGFAAGLIPEGAGPRSALRLFVIVGCLGGFTTFSSFGLETLRLMEESRLLAASGYVLLSNIGGLALCFLGAWGSGLLGR
jgi:CrcB protein